MSERETSDLFGIDPAAARPSILPVAEVLTPPEELRRLRRNRILKITIALVLLALALAIAFSLWRSASIESAMLKASDQGTAAAITAALEELGEGDPARRAQLLAMSALQGSTPLEEASAAVEALQDAQAPSALFARSLLALAQGEGVEARRINAAMLPVGEYAAEVLHIRSMAAQATGTTGLEDAEAILAQLPEHAHAPRYRAQASRARLLQGNIDGALEVLEGARPADAPAILVARAHAMIEGRRGGAGDALRAALASTELSPRDRAWAQLLDAKLQALTGAMPAALSTLGEATAHTPPGDAYFLWSAAEVALRAGDRARAASLAEGLAPNIPATSLVSRTRAWLALSGGDAEAALALLSGVPASPDAQALVAETMLALRRFEEAKAAADSLQAQAPWRAEGLVLGARVESARGAKEAAALLAHSAAEASPTHARIIAEAAQVLLESDQAAAALELIAPISASNEEDAEVLRVHAAALIASDRGADALAPLRAAIALRPESFVLQEMLAETALSEGELEEALAAATRAVAIDPRAGAALLTLAKIKLARLEHAEVQAILDRAEEADADEEARIRLQAQLWVELGEGVNRTREVSRWSRIRALRRDPLVPRTLAELYLQASMYNPAINAFNQALQAGGDRLECLGGIAIARAYDRKGNLANSTLERALEEEGGSEHPRILVAQARLALNAGRRPRAIALAEQALAQRPRMSEAQWVVAEARSRGEEFEAALAAALALPTPQANAHALAARRAGASEEGCAHARRYLEVSTSRADQAEAMEELVERCEADS